MPILQTLLLIAWLGSGVAALVLGLVAVRLAGRRMQSARVAALAVPHDELLAA